MPLSAEKVVPGRLPVLPLPRNGMIGCYDDVVLG